MKTLKLISICLFAILIGCKNDTDTQIAFDKTKWAMAENAGYPYRDVMLDDLIDSKKLKGLTKPEILDLLGEPTRIDGDYLFYRVSENKIGLMTMNTKTLVLVLSVDGKVDKVLIHE